MNYKVMTVNDPLRYWLAHISGRMTANTLRYIHHVLQNPKLRKRLLVFMAVVLLVGVKFAVGQSNPVPSAAGNSTSAVSSIDPFKFSGYVTQIAGSIDTALANLASNSAFRNAGAQLLGAGLLIGMLWTGIKTMGTGKGIGDLFAEWVPLFVAAGVVTLFIDPTATGPTAIVQTMNGITGAISGVNVSSVAAFMPDAVEKMMANVAAVINTPTATEAKMADILNGSIFFSLGVKLMSWFMTVIISLVVVLAGCVYIAIAIFAMVSVKLALALAPILVPFLVFGPLDFLFFSWLKFLLGACMMQVVGGFMLNLTGGFMSSMTSVAQQIRAETQGDGVQAFMADVLMYDTMLLLAVMMALLMSQTPAIAAGLISGAGSGGGFKGMGAMTNSMGARSMEAGGTKAWQSTGGSTRAANQGKNDAMDRIPASAQKHASAPQQRAYMEAYTRNKPPPSGGGGASPSKGP